MNNRLERFANSSFMLKLQQLSVKLSQSPAFGTISVGMGGTMGLIMIGAVIQIICAIGGLAFDWKAGTPIYDALYMPYELTMGLLGLFMSFTLAYNYAKRLGVKATIQVALDVNPFCFEKMGATPDDLSVFAQLKVDILRMDLSYGPEGDAKLVNNPYGISIEFNNDPEIVNGLIQRGIDPKLISVCHNFYPQRYTAMKWDKFIQKNIEIKSISREVGISAFISSNAPHTHGVWNAVFGLPTVERLRTLPIDLQARMILATGDVDDLLIGNAYASEEEFKKLHEVMQEPVQSTEALDPTLAMLVKHGIIDLNKPIKRLRVTLDPDVTEKEKEVLFDFAPHLEMGDSSEWIWRTRISRFKYSQPDQILTPRRVEDELFAVGDVVMVNDNYKHYAGEIQIVKIPIVNDGTRNRLGHLDAEEYQLMDLIHDGDLVEFLEK